MAFQRKLELSVGSSGTGLLISSLDVSFEVVRTTALGENTASFTVYNAKENTRNKILTKGNNIICRAGYADEGVKSIFLGNIISAYSYKSNADWITKVNAASIRSSQEELQYIAISSSYSPGTKFSRILEDIALSANLVISGASNASFTVLNGWTYAGSFRGALDYIKKVLKNHDLGMYVDNDEMVIFLLDEKDSKFGTTLLSYTGGLLSVEEKSETDEGKKQISIKSLLIPTMQPNGLAIIQTNKLSGTFVLQKVTHKGNNFGGDFITESEATS